MASRSNKPGPGTQINRSAPSARGFVARWLMNEGAGGIVTDGVNGIRGTLTGVDSTQKPWVAGQRGTAISLDGTNDFIDLGSSLALQPTAAGSYLLWCYPTGNGASAAYALFGASTFATDRNGVTFWQQNQAGLPSVRSEVCSASGATITANGGPAMTLNAWNLVGLTWDGTTITEYCQAIGGSLNSRTTSQTVVPTAGTNPLRIGASNTGGNPWAGMVGDAAVCNRAITRSEFSAFYSDPYAAYGSTRRYFGAGATVTNAYLIGEGMIAA